MGCQICFQNPRLFSPVSSLSKIKNSSITTQRLVKVLVFSTNLDKQKPISTVKRDGFDVDDDLYNVKFQTLGGCKLGISRYPDFEYNAEGGSGSGAATAVTEIAEDDEELNGEVSVEFDLKKLFIPPLTSATTRFLGLPLPPFLKIDIVPQLFRGRIDRATGKVELEFMARFWFSAGDIYRAPPLLVETTLTSEESKGKIRNGRGQRLDENGRCRLVGVATVEPINDLFMNSFLSLPTECLADMSAIITFTDT